jgi:hypothetical protein
MAGLTAMEWRLVGFIKQTAEQATPSSINMPFPSWRLSGDFMKVKLTEGGNKDPQYRGALHPGVEAKHPALLLGLTNKMKGR